MPVLPSPHRVCVALFGFLNRWNDGLGTTLEAEPLTFGNTHLGDSGWQSGMHDPKK